MKKKDILLEGTHERRMAQEGRRAGLRIGSNGVIDRRHTKINGGSDQDKPRFGKGGEVDSQFVLFALLKFFNL